MYIKPHLLVGSILIYVHPSFSIAALKNSYVDVFNPSGAPMSAAPQTVLAPLMAPVAVPQGGFFVPGAVPDQQPQQPQ